MYGTMYGTQQAVRARGGKCKRKDAARLEVLMHRAPLASV